MDWEAIGRGVGERLGRTLPPGRAWPIGGGCINSAFRYEAGAESWFLKVNRAERLPLFEAEAAGLALLSGAEGPRVPGVVGTGRAGGYAWLALEYVQLRSLDDAAQARLGERLAALHRTVGPAFGWERDNALGCTPQFNGYCADWVEFYRERRLRPQLAWAAAAGHGALAEEAGPLLEALGRFFTTYRPAPSLLHGDLWSGNAAADVRGEAVIFDPACYFGDREADLAMTELFGGFESRFYVAYAGAWPLDEGYRVRKGLYQLYQVLNHLKLFGGGHLGQAQRLIRELRAEL